MFLNSPKMYTDITMLCFTKLDLKEFKNNSIDKYSIKDQYNGMR
jgi:hypothetical protein